MSVVTYTKTGNKAATAAKLDKQVFNVSVNNHELLKQAYVAYLANGRENLAVTKTRGLVSGGGKKPWRQKGTGRARFGSTRNPIWRGGGIAFGPTGNETYGHNISTKNKRAAIRQALTLAADSKKLIVVENLHFKDAKTAAAAQFFSKIGVNKNALIVVDSKIPEITRPIKNLPNVKMVSARYINVFDALNADHIVVTTAALNEISLWLGEAKATPKKEGAAA